MTDQFTPRGTRRPGIRARGIRLSDGELWDFALPTIRLVPRVESVPDQLGRSVERITIAVAYGYPSSISKLVSELRVACDHDSVTKQYEAFFSLAASLLLRAHEITPGVACELLSVSDDELERLATEVMSVVLEPRQAPEESSLELSDHA